MRRARALLMSLTMVPGLWATPASAPAPGGLVEMTELVRFLRARVAGEDPSGSARASAAALKAELARLDMVLPPGADPSTLDDLHLAGLLLEERRRSDRSLARRKTLGQVQAALSAEVEGLLAEVSEVAPDFQDEVAEIFEDLREGPRRPAEPPHPAALLRQRRAGAAAAPAARPAASATRSAAKASTRPAATQVAAAPGKVSLPSPRDDSLEAIGAELRAALAGDKAPVSQDPFFGDRSFVVASPGVARPAVRKSATRPDASQALGGLRAKVAVRQASARAPRPAAKARPVARSVAGKASAASQVAPLGAYVDAGAAQPPRLFESGLDQVVRAAAAKVAARKAATPQVATSARAPEVTLARVPAAKASPAKVGPAKVAPAKVAPAKVAPAKVAASAASKVRAHEVEELLGMLGPQLAHTVSDDTEFAAALRSALEVLGLETPASFRPQREAPSAQLASQLIAVGVDPGQLREARAAMGL